MPVKGAEMLAKQDMSNLPTMEMIAKRLGVSKMTVSRVLNNHPYVSDKVRKKVQDIMKELKYRPNMSAAVLSRRSSKTLGLILQFYNNNIFSTYYLMEVLYGVEQALDAYGYNLVLFSRIQPRKNFEDITNWYYGGMVKGFILVAPSLESPVVKALIKEKANFIIVSGKSVNKSVNWIDTDNVRGGYLATEHLLKLGHRKIAFISGQIDSENSLDREQGYYKALAEYGVKPNKNYIVSGEFEQKLAYKGMTKLLEAANPPTAVFAANDLMALGALQAAKEKGLKVPRDLSIVGFDNIDLAISSEPALTTISQDAKTLGKLAAEFLVNHGTEKGGMPLQKILDVSLIKRESTAVLK